MAKHAHPETYIVNCVDSSNGRHFQKRVLARSPEEAMREASGNGTLASDAYLDDHAPAIPAAENRAIVEAIGSLTAEVQALRADVVSVDKTIKNAPIMRAPHGTIALGIIFAAFLSACLGFLLFIVATAISIYANAPLRR